MHEIKSKESEEVLWGKFEAEYKGNIIEDFVKIFIYKMIKFLKINEDIILLDAGIGPEARFTIPALKAKASIVGLDISKNVIRTARNKLNSRTFLGHWELIIGDLMYNPFRERMFDRVVCIATIYHMPNLLGLQKALKEFAWLMKIDGILLLDIGNLLSPLNWMKIFSIKLLQFLRLSRRSHLYISFNYLTNLIQIIGLKKIKIIPRFHLDVPFFYNPFFKILQDPFTLGWKRIDDRISRISRNNTIVKMLAGHYFILLGKYDKFC